MHKNEQLQIEGGGGWAIYVMHSLTVSENAWFPSQIKFQCVGLWDLNFRGALPTEDKAIESI